MPERRRSSFRVSIELVVVSDEESVVQHPEYGRITLEALVEAPSCGNLLLNNRIAWVHNARPIASFFLSEHYSVCADGREVLVVATVCTSARCPESGLMGQIT